ncbi:MAG: carcinine hydrolase/isopenicillin-N N-acyltransferase family protein [Bacteroidales bacterium]|nr:carcinine hydrolase/isopenicillin-N N-acyltransferase family protein [Bacteroidales bacterium]
MKRLLALLALMAAVQTVLGCTSMIVSGRASDSGRPLLWKHRDTGADNNFLARVEPTDSTLGYVALFNAGDSLLAEAWMGMNDAGLAIMNTASYNLAPDTAAYKDREGAVMTLALRQCRSVDDFEHLLASLPRPMGVQANFGVIDAYGAAAYFETDDNGAVRYDVADTPDGVLVRTNYSVGGADGKGSGYIRCNTACRLTADAVASHTVSPATFTEGVSRSFYHSLTGHDYLAEGERFVANQDFVPRDISTASIVIEGVNPGYDPSETVMWAVLGYPPCSSVGRVTLTDIPADFGPDLTGWRSSACDRARDLYRSAIPYPGGSGPRYLDLDVLRPIIVDMHRRSMQVYEKYR